MFSKIEGPTPEDQSGAAAPSGRPDERALRRVTAQFAAGVAIVTTRHAGGLHGLTVSAYLTASWNPPLVLIAVDTLSQSCDYIIASGHYAVNFLSDRQEFLAERFAGRAPLVSARFEGVPHHFAATGSPVLEGALGWLDCKIEQIIDAGDHTLFLGRVLQLGEGVKDKALVYFARRYRSLEPD
ncbi:MAG TPA: flavin reductase family protein [Anaerolineae bacterium]|nr:flavin reductase family protein [Anaerolineae bacterium]